MLLKVILLFYHLVDIVAYLEAMYVFAGLRVFPRLWACSFLCYSSPFSCSIYVIYLDDQFRF